MTTRSRVLSVLLIAALTASVRANTMPNTTAEPAIETTT